MRITREGGTAVIEYADPGISGVNLVIGDAIETMTDREILDMHNDIVAAQEQSLRDWDNTVIEIPPGKPQIRKSRLSGQWVPQGEVLRCIIEDDERGAMLAHEHAHIRHRDIARRIVLDILLCVGAPLASVIRRLWDSATERLCDARAAAETGDSESVASAMVKVCRLGVRPELSAASFPPPGHSVEERVHAVLGERSTGDRASCILLVVSAATVLSIVLVASAYSATVHDMLEAVLG